MGLDLDRAAIRVILPAVRITGALAVYRVIAYWEASGRDVHLRPGIRSDG